MGAMENWGLVTYREAALMIDADKASIQQKQRVAIVVAHELAHQWFGNLVTMAWWDGLWLNEGFAAFMEHFCVDALYPEYRIWEQVGTARQDLLTLLTSPSPPRCLWWWWWSVHDGRLRRGAAPGQPAHLAPHHRAHQARRGGRAGGQTHTRTHTRTRTHG